jgi:hypothetical protein
MTIYILNTSVIPNEGTYSLHRTDLDTARFYAGTAISAIGHESTAQLISQVLGINIPANRTAIEMEPGDYAVVFKLNQRPPEGVVLSCDQLKELGYDFYIMTRLLLTEGAPN